MKVEVMYFGTAKGQGLLSVYEKEIGVVDRQQRASWSVESRELRLSNSRGRVRERYCFGMGQPSLCGEHVTDTSIYNETTTVAPECRSAVPLVM